MMNSKKKKKNCTRKPINPKNLTFLFILSFFPSAASLSLLPFIVFIIQLNQFSLSLFSTPPSYTSQQKRNIKLHITIKEKIPFPSFLPSLLYFHQLRSPFSTGFELSSSMGCKGSKLDEQQPVVLCRGRSDLISAAVRHRFALADSHAAVSASLLSFSDALRLLLNEPPPSISLPPPHRKPSPSPPPNHQVDDKSHSGSHLHFHPSDSDSDNGSVHSSVYSPLHQHNEEEPFMAMPYHPYQPQIPYNNYPTNFNPNYLNTNDNYYNNTSYNMYYAKSKPPKRSVTIQQPVPSSEMGYSTHGYNNLYSNPYFYGETGETGNGFYSHRPTRPATSAPAPAPPSPPKVNTWDFLNPFESSYNYGNNYESGYNYRTYTPSRSSKEVREEEGIPDLEAEEGMYSEVVKEVYRDDKSIASSSSTEIEEIRHTSTGRYEARRSDVEKEVQEIVDKKVVSNNNNEIKREKKVVDNNNNNKNNNKRREIGEVSDFVNEIKDQFERASEAAKELGLLLEVGKRRYEMRNSVYQVSARMVSAMAPLSISTDVELFNKNSNNNNDEENKEINGSNNGSLSLTMQKLYIWEKKLYDEVKAEEKMRLLLSKTSKKLRLLDQKGAEPHKVEATRKLARKLTTKIRIAIKVVNSISNKINKVRDEELWPQINSLIQGFTRMWSQILDCHQTQTSLIAHHKAQNLDSLTSNKNLIQLELELIKFSVNFSSWVNTQKSFIKALNGWLSLCLNPEPESAISGAPPIFVICNAWSREIEKVEEGGVVEAMRCLAWILKREMETQFLLDQVGLAKERERWEREMERRSCEIGKEIESLNKKLVLVPGENALRLEGLSGGRVGFESGEGFGGGFKGLVEEMKRFAEGNLRVYEELGLCVERVGRVE